MDATSARCGNSGTSSPCERRTTWRSTSETTVLREAVLNDVAASWAICLEASTNGAAFDGFFRQYCRDVERDVDPALRNTIHHAEEYRRVWTAHALNLRAAVAV